MPCCRDQYKPRAIRLELVGTEVPGVAQERGDARSRWHDACALHPACSPALPAAEESRSAPGSPPAGTGTGLRARIPQRERLRCFSSGKVHGEAIRRGACWRPRCVSCCNPGARGARSPVCPQISRGMLPHAAGRCFGRAPGVLSAPAHPLKVRSRASPRLAAAVKLQFYSNDYPTR